ncbi:MAG: hypothetical protein GF398_11645 [Chitinivibrionales bacterium]|nr:hypothetical protein [Chitinivibrionales bacterium]
MNSMRSAIIGGALLWVIISMQCQKASVNPTQITVSSSGKAAAGQVVSMLELTRTIDDVRRLKNPFDFSRALLDTNYIELDYWDESGMVQSFGAGLGKLRVGPRALFTAFTATLAASSQSVNRGEAFPDPQRYDTTRLDSLIHAQSISIRVEYRVDSAVAAPWKNARDSLFGHWQDLPSTPNIREHVLDSLKRYRRLDSAQTTWQDFELWQFVGETSIRLVEKNLVAARQTDSSRLYQHRAVLSADTTLIEDYVFVQDNAQSHAYVVERLDKSTQWWTQVAGSKLIAFTDTLYTGRGTSSIEHLSPVVLLRICADSTDTVGKAFVYDFTQADSLQLVRSITATSRPDGTRDTVDIAYAYRTTSDGAEKKLKYYTKRIHFTDQTRLTYDLQNVITDTTASCTLKVRIRPSAGAPIEPRFGLSRRTFFDYTLTGDAGFTDFDIIAISREDVVQSDEFDLILWNYTPSSPVSLHHGNLLDSTGVLEVTGYHRLGRSTAFERWRRRFRDRIDSVWYTWAGTGGYRADTISIAMEWEADSAVSYTYATQGYYSRRGHIAYRAGDTTATDSLFVENGAYLARRIRGAFTALPVDSFLVDGARAYRLGLSSDSAWVRCAISDSCPGSQAPGFALGDTLISSSYLDPQYGFRMNFAFTAASDRFITGTMVEDSLTSGAMRVVDIRLSPLNSGTATMYGIFNNIDESMVNPRNVYGVLSIELWGENRIGSSDYLY